MGRTIPSFRQLLEIEKLSWSCFKKELPTKMDRNAFDKLFENAELYASYLSNAVNPIPLESVVMGALFHNYKTLLDIHKENAAEWERPDNDITMEGEPQLQLSIDDKPHSKMLFDKTCEKWQGLMDSFHKEDKKILLKMILEICRYGESCNKIINDIDSKSCITYMFFISLLIRQQKLISNTGKYINNTSSGTKFGKGKTLMDFMA
jgi:hypothetical protein